MATECTFDVSLSVMSTGLTERVDLNDRAAGLTLLNPLVLPDEERRQDRLKSARVNGSFPVGALLDDDGVVAASVRIDGSSWAEVATRQEALRTALRLDDERYVRVDIAGVVRTWFSDGPVSIRFGEITSDSLLRSSMTYELRFTVQPNPTVSIGA